VPAAEDEAAVAETTEPAAEDETAAAAAELDGEMVAAARPVEA
jgi:hypothetical protein